MSSVGDKETGDEVVDIWLSSCQRNPPPFQVRDYVLHGEKFLDAKWFVVGMVG